VDTAEPGSGGSFNSSGEAQRREPACLPSRAGVVTLFRLTFGHYTQAGAWTDVRELSGSELACLLTTHSVGLKPGTCVVPAVFRGADRHKADAEQIDVAFLDCDAGHTLQEIKQALAAMGCAAIISSTHSHGTTRSKVSRREFEAVAAGHDDAPARYLREKGYQPRVCAGARVVEQDDGYIILEHSPCPKFRVVVPLLKPWRAADYPNQDAANAAWKERVQALAAALGLQHDQACTDTSRLFYLPRRPADGPPPESAVLDGTLCDIFGLPAPKAMPELRTPTRFGLPIPPKVTYADPATGEVHDLSAWARDYASRFEIAKALQARRPGALVGKVVDDRKHHIRCPNEDGHTDPGADSATIVINASQSNTKGFVIHCRHAHCVGQDRLFFLRRMLEQRWLSTADLTAPEFLQEIVANPEVDDVISKGDEVTEAAVAAVFRGRFKGELRYCHHAGRWYRWTGAIWQREETRYAFDAIRRTTCEVASASGDGKVRRAAERAAFVAGVERFAQADRVFGVSASHWDQDAWLLGTPGGTVDLRTGALRPAQRGDYITRSTAVTPAASADCPLWLRFLDEATGSDAELIAFLQRWAGYCLTGDTREHALLFVYGPGGNGKGVLLVTLAGILDTYAATAAMDTFASSPGDRHPTDLAMLHGARLVMTTETEEGRAWAEARIKALTGGDPITARFMRQDFFTFMPAFKLTISGNHKPALRNVDDAARRRFNVVPFLHKPPNPDRELVSKLKAEWPAILRWMIEGCLAWQTHGLMPPAAVQQATAEYFAEQDMLTQWLEECCDKNKDYGETASRLFASWRSFASNRGEDTRNTKWFSTMLERHGFQRAKDCALFRGRGFMGLRLRPEAVAPHWQDGT
jgi:P4 family phage/plasmid primase-like protien